MFTIITAISLRSAVANAILATAILFVAGCGDSTGRNSQSPQAVSAPGAALATNATTDSISTPLLAAAQSVSPMAAALAVDSDGDGIDDATDNCTNAANPDQRDSNGDGFGNRCDGDVNNNGIVDSQDLALLEAAFGSPNFPDYDINGNGIVDSQDGAAMKAAIGQPPGPAAVIEPPVASIFPLRVEPGKRYLVDAQGQPFFMNGDTAWSAMVQLDPADAEAYLESRRQLGINTVLINLIEHRFGDDVPNNHEGEGPFLSTGDYATPNDAYFEYADFIVNLAAAKGILVLLTPSYMGYQGGVEGWYQKMVNNGATRLRNYGRYLGQHFAGRDNILWVHGGDYDPGASGLALANAIVAGIREYDPAGRWLHTFHADRGTSASDSIAGGESWLAVNNIYTSSTDVVSKAFAEYPSSPQPFFLIEGRYEDDGGNGPYVRLQAYQALLSGASGHLIGNDPMWYFGAGWPNYLASEGAGSMAFIKSLFTSRAWWTLVPDKNATFLTGGVGSGESRAAGALASDSSFGLVFTPARRALTINLARLAGPRVTARWYDPANGNYSPIAGSPFNATGSRAFTPSGTNSQGAADWVLVLESIL